MLLATTAQRREVNGDDVLSATKCADDLIRAEAGFDSSIVVGTGVKPSSPFFYPCRMIGVDVAAGELETVAVRVLPTVYVYDFAFQAGDRCECTDGNARVFNSPWNYDVVNSYRNNPFECCDHYFDGATVYRNDKPVAILTKEKPPEPPVVHVDDFAFQVGDRCECRDHVPRTIATLGDDGRPDRYNFGTSVTGVHRFARFSGLFNEAKVSRDGKVVAVLSTDPATKKPFEFQIGDVVIIPDVCGRIITNTYPLRWTGGGRLDSSELDDQCKEFARQLRKGAVWRGGELVREAVV